MTAATIVRPRRRDSDTARARRPRPAPCELDHAGAGREIPGRDPVRLEDHDVGVGGAAVELPRDHLLELVHLEPVEDAALDRLDQVARLELGLLARVAADERRPLEHRVVELAARRVVRADRADERSLPQPLAAEHRVLRGRDGDDDVGVGRLAVGLGRLAPVLAAELGEPLARSGSRPSPARSSGRPRGCTRSGRRPASRSRSRRGSLLRHARGTSPRRRRPRRCAAGRACRPRSPPRAVSAASSANSRTTNGVPVIVQAYDLSPA